MKTAQIFLSILTMSLAVCTTAVAADYTLQIPPGWDKVKGSTALEHFMKKGVSFILTVDQAPPSAKTPDEFVAYAKKALTGAFKNVKFEPVKMVSINGREAREVVYTGEVSGIKMKYDAVYILRNGTVYALTIGGSEQTFEAVKADYSAIFNSFKMK
jgi:hypothetical protein